MSLKCCLALLLLPLTAGSAAGHAGAAEIAAEGPGFEVFQIVLIAGAALLYANGLMRLRREVGGSRVVVPSQILAFAAGIGAVVVALLSPLDDVADDLFSAHMVQHLLLIMVAPPLLVWSRPALVSLWAFPRRDRKSIGSAWNAFGLSAGVRYLMQPLVVATLFCGVFAFWHLPRPYVWALSNEWVHAVEHASFFLTSLMFWALVIEPSGSRRMGLAPTMLFVAAVAVVSGLPGALILLSPDALYGIHAEGAAKWGLTPAEDQQLAGLIMWIPAGLAYLAPIGWLFVKMMRESECAVSRVGAIVLICLAVPMGLGACSKISSRERASAQRFETAKLLMTHYGCGACHAIPGVTGADGRVGPPLGGVGNRIFIAGMLRNTPANMAKWLEAPQSVAPGNAMPDMGVKPEEARVMASYLERSR